MIKPDEVRDMKTFEQWLEQEKMHHRNVFYNGIYLDDGRLSDANARYSTLRDVSAVFQRAKRGVKV